MNSPADLALITSVLSVIGLPVIALSTLILTKLATGDSAPKAQRRFFAVLIATTAVTANTVVHQDGAWLVHTVTLAILIVGALWVPSAADFGATEADSLLLP